MCFFFSFLGHTLWPVGSVCPPGIEPMPPAVEVGSLNHWTTREVPVNGNNHIFTETSKLIFDQTTGYHSLAKLTRKLIITLFLTSRQDQHPLPSSTSYLHAILGLWIPPSENYDIF